MPKETLKAYAASIDRLKDSRIIMVIRGCINGCSKLMPTANFVKSIMAPSEKEQLQVEVQIDPNLFHLYNIKVVPAIVFASGVQLDVNEGSEGNLSHIVSIPASYSVYGDVSLDFALEKINSKVNNSRLNSILAEIRKGWYGR
jgi:type-F conjugative transfer system pilin assembly protein TrbC